MAGDRSKIMAMVATSKPTMTYQEIDYPKPGSGQVTVKISHVAQNPTDVQSYDSGAFGDGAVYGCDYVGSVVEVGENVSRIKAGDQIAGLIWGGEIKGLGGYAEYTIADEKICFKVPSAVSPAEASTIPLALTTAWLALFSKDCLAIDRTKQHSVLIWGGSSSVGQYAIQIAALYSMNIVTTCSPKNFDLVKQLGATHVLDYNSSSITKDIKDVAPDLKYFFDTIGSKDSSAQGCEAANSDCTMCTVRPGKANTEKVASLVKITDVLVWTAFLKDHAFGEFKWPASQEDHDLCSELHDKVAGWIEQGKIRPNAVLPLQGLKSVPDGFQMHRDGKISAQKIVYEL